MSAPTPYFNTWGVNNNTYDRIIDLFKQVVGAMYEKPSFGFGPMWQYNADNQLTFPSIWIEPTATKMISSVQGIRVYKCSFYIYALDRIDKGDDNYQQILSDTDGMIKDIMSFIRESAFARLNYIIVDNTQDMEMTPVLEATDEYVNGWRAKISLRIPDISTPCNIPIKNISPYPPTPPTPPQRYVDIGYVDNGYVVGD